MAEASSVRAGHGLWPYVQMARVDHWFKNAFMLLGVIVALFVEPSLMRWDVVPILLLAFLATCLVASSNYVLNEMLDAPYDRKHPVKKYRPAAAEKVRRRFALAEWLGLGALGLGLSLLVNRWFALAALALWVMGVLYNVKPVRTKEIPYLDVLSEAINNPLRLLLGWFAVTDRSFPPVSLFVAYWMAGAFFMGIKRLAEYRRIGDPAVAAAYRSSFRHYDEDRLLVSLFFYAVLAGLFSGVFVVRYHLELILALPLVAGFFAYYVKIGLREDSPVQHPEQLHRERGFVLYALLCSAVVALLMLSHIPLLYDLFNVQAAQTPPLWTLD
jgi:4-hydroxybenzoate polyprenyltransferase